MGKPGSEAARPESASHVHVEPWPELESAKAPCLDEGVLVARAE